jgi:hypothetical protein
MTPAHAPEGSAPATPDCPRCRRYRRDLERMRRHERSIAGAASLYVSALVLLAAIWMAVYGWKS